LLALGNFIRSSGQVIYKGNDISQLAPDRIVKAGMVLVPEGRGTIATLTVEENLEMGAYTRTDDWRADLEDIYRRFPVLKERRAVMAQSMSGGEQQMLAIARAMLAKPGLLLLDEPSMGLAPLLVAEVFEIVKQLNREGATILLVEQNANAALRISHRGYVLESGRLVAEGPSDTLASNPQIMAAYLS
jgi:branched-chain amino acid transport system ATP-binding protein